MPGLGQLASVGKQLDNFKFAKAGDAISDGFLTKSADEFNKNFGVPDALKKDPITGEFKFFDTPVTALKTAGDLDGVLKRVELTDPAAIKSIDDAFATPRTKEYFPDPDLQKAATDFNVKEGRKNVAEAFSPKDPVTGKVALEADGVTPKAPIMDGSVKATKFNTMLTNLGKLVLGVGAAAALTIGALQAVASAKNGCFLMDNKNTPDTGDDVKLDKLTGDADPKNCTCTALEQQGILMDDTCAQMLTACSSTKTCGGPYGPVPPAPQTQQTTDTFCLCGSALSSITLTAQKATWLTVLEDLANGVAKIFDKLGNLANAFLDTVTGLITIGVPIIVSIVVIIIIAVVVSKVMQNRKNAAASGMAAPAKGATPG
jgi:hypothetical protein